MGDRIEWAFEQVRQIPSPARLVLLYLTWQADDQSGLCAPSRVSIHQTTGQSLSSISEGLSELLRLRLVSETGLRAGVTGQVKEYQVSGALTAWESVQNLPGLSQESLQISPGFPESVQNLPGLSQESLQIPPGFPESLQNLPGLTQESVQNLPGLSQESLQISPGFPESVQNLPGLSQESLQIPPGFPESLQNLPGLTQESVQNLPGLSEESLQISPALPPGSNNNINNTKDRVITTPGGETSQPGTGQVGFMPVDVPGQPGGDSGPPSISGPQYDYATHLLAQTGLHWPDVMTAWAAIEPGKSPPGSLSGCSKRQGQVLMRWLVSQRHLEPESAPATARQVKLLRKLLQEASVDWSTVRQELSSLTLPEALEDGLTKAQADLVIKWLKESGNHATESPSTSPQKSKPPFEPPAWWEPLTKLDGYVARDHSRFVSVLEQTCGAQGVQPAAVVKGFADYYSGNRFRHGWRDPVAALRRTLEIEIKKLLQDKPATPRSLHQRRIDAEKRVPIRQIERV